MTRRRRYEHCTSLVQLILTFQIDQLENMFNENFRYTVYKKSLNAVRGKAAKVLLQKYIADVVWEVDEPNSLLIVYYAGHGNPGQNGDIILTGYVCEKSRKTRIDLEIGVTITQGLKLTQSYGVKLNDLCEMRRNLTSSSSSTVATLVEYQHLTLGKRSACGTLSFLLLQLG